MIEDVELVEILTNEIQLGVEELEVVTSARAFMPKLCA